MGTSRIAVKSDDQQDSCLVSKTSLGTSRIGLKSLRVLGPAR